MNCSVESGGGFLILPIRAPDMDSRDIPLLICTARNHDFRVVLMRRLQVVEPLEVVVVVMISREPIRIQGAGYNGRNSKCQNGHSHR